MRPWWRTAPPRSRPTANATGRRRRRRGSGGRRWNGPCAGGWPASWRCPHWSRRCRGSATPAAVPGSPISATGPRTPWWWTAGWTSSPATGHRAGWRRCCGTSAGRTSATGARARTPASAAGRGTPWSTSGTGAGGRRAAHAGARAGRSVAHRAVGRPVAPRRADPGAPGVPHVRVAGALARPGPAVPAGARPGHRRQGAGPSRHRLLRHVQDPGVPDALPGGVAARTVVSAAGRAVRP
ncbi:hypothetical protein ADL04_28245 [Streptomyces sp. NRRL B-3648]|nr:hypothetical protein ADL04_28245 [Streptomyces sp. NRRL B-3648]